MHCSHLVAANFDQIVRIVRVARVAAVVCVAANGIDEVGVHLLPFCVSLTTPVVYIPKIIYQ